MYYSEEILEEIRTRVDIVEVISERVKLKKSGSSFMGLCPFHNEKTPSFSVTPRKHMFYCFGCHKGGSVITFIQEYENATFQEAVEILAARAGIELPQREERPEDQQRRSRKSRMLEMNKLAGTFYYCCLKSPQGQIGMQYFKDRGLTDETIRSFGLGYAGKFSSQLYRYLTDKGFEYELIQAAGLINPGDDRKGITDRFFNRVMFPIMDESNRVIGFGGRVLGDAKPKYLNSPESDIFNKRRNLYGLNVARRSREDFLILCEGYMDVIALHQAGFTNAVASLGTALTAEHARLLRKYTKQVILSYDSDAAGTDAAIRAIPLLREEGIRARILKLSPCKDPDEFIRTFGAEALRERLDQSQNSFLFEIEVLRRAYDMKDPESRTAFQKETARKIARFELSEERENYIEAVAEHFGMRFEGLREMVGRVLSSGVILPDKPDTSIRTRKTATRSDTQLLSQRRLLTWLTQYPNFYGFLKQYVLPEDYAPGFYREAARMLYDQLENGQLNEAAIIDYFDNSENDEDHVMAAQLFHTTLEHVDRTETLQAMRETIVKVLGGQPDEGMDAPEISPEDKMRMIQRKLRMKRELEQLKKMELNPHLLDTDEEQEES